MNKLPTQIIKFIGFILLTHYNVITELIDLFKHLGGRKEREVFEIICHCGTILNIKKDKFNYTIECNNCNTIIYAPSTETCTYTWTKCNEDSRTKQ